jgi:hypothetical protein
MVFQPRNTQDDIVLDINNIKHKCLLVLLDVQSDRNSFGVHPSGLSGGAPVGQSQSVWLFLVAGFDVASLDISRRNVVSYCS